MHFLGTRPLSRLTRNATCPRSGHVDPRGLRTRPTRNATRPRSGQVDPRGFAYAPDAQQRASSTRPLISTTTGSLDSRGCGSYRVPCGFACRPHRFDRTSVELRDRRDLDPRGFAFRPHRFDRPAPSCAIDAASTHVGLHAARIASTARLSSCAIDAASTHVGLHAHSKRLDRTSASSDSAVLSR